MRKSLLSKKRTKGVNAVIELTPLRKLRGICVIFADQVLRNGDPDIFALIVLSLVFQVKKSFDAYLIRYDFFQGTTSRYPSSTKTER